MEETGKKESMIRPILHKESGVKGNRSIKNIDDMIDNTVEYKNSADVFDKNTNLGVNKRRTVMKACKHDNSYTLLSLNTYLIPPSVSYNPYSWGAFWGCRRVSSRAKNIGELCKDYDLICLQEVWGSSLNRLYNPIKSTHTILPEYESTSSWYADIVNPLKLFCSGAGGIWNSWRRSKFSFVLRDRHFFDFLGQVPFSNQNITLILLEQNDHDNNNRFHSNSGYNNADNYNTINNEKTNMKNNNLKKQENPSKSDVILKSIQLIDYESMSNVKKHIALFNTHFSIFGGKAREININGTREFIKLSIWKLYLVRIAYKMDDLFLCCSEVCSKDQKIDKYGCNVFENLSVLLVGDFNIDSTRLPKTYKTLQTLHGLVKMRDLFSPSENPSYNKQQTYYTQEKANSDTATGNSLFPWNFKGRIDYIFGIDEMYLSPSDVEELMRRFPPEKLLSTDINTSALSEELIEEEYNRLRMLDIPIQDDGSLIFYFSKVTCLGMDILKQHYGAELSDHWALSARLTGNPPDISDSQKLYKNIIHKKK